MPCPKDWVVLDGLNYVKDRLDGTLSYRWSCRMGICGSCGMTVNGEPKLTCATFLTDYAPGPVRVEPLRNFPVIRDLVVEIGDFMRKLPSVKPWIIRDGGEAAVGGRVPADAGGAGRVQAVQHVHQLHAVLRRLPGLRASTRSSSARPPSPWRSATTSIRATRGRGAPGDPLRARGHLGLHLRRRVHEGLSEERRSGRRHPALQADGGARLAQVVLHAAGRAMNGRPAYTSTTRAGTGAACPPTGGCARVLLRVHPARAEQRLRRLVRRVSAAARSRGEPGRRSATRRSSAGRATRRSGAERRDVVLRRVHASPGSTWRPRRWWCAWEASACRDADRRVQLPGLGVVSALVAWSALGACMAKRPIEPFLWLLFSAGGVLVGAADARPRVPVRPVAFPLGWLSPPSYAHLAASSAIR